MAPRHVVVAVVLSGVCSLAAGCTGASGSFAAGVPSTAAAPAPNVGSFLPTNYRVLRVSQVGLEAPPHPADVVVVSAGPGMASSQPVQGGTEDVQVLSYDSIAQRWNVAFDAADKVVSPGYLSVAPAADSGAQALLPQGDALIDVMAVPVQFVSGPPRLVIYGVDESVNHPPGLLGVLDLSTGTPTLAYYDSQVDMSAPTISGAVAAQRISINAAFDSSADPACCPVRQFRQVIGAMAGTHTAPLTIGVLEDDRPWLGVWYVTPDGPGGPVIVAGVVDGSPASAVLQVGDRLLGVADTGVPSGDAAQPVVVDQVAVHHPGDRIVLRVERDGKMMSASLVTSGYGSTSYQDENMAPQAAVLGVEGLAAPVGMAQGVVIQQLLPDGPAATSGLGIGDEITGLGSAPVRSVTDLQVALMGQAGKQVVLAVRRVDGTMGMVSVVPQVASSGTAGVLYAAGL